MNLEEEFELLAIDIDAGHKEWSLARLKNIRRAVKIGNVVDYLTDLKPFLGRAGINVRKDMGPYLESLGIENVDKILKSPEPPCPSALSLELLNILLHYSTFLGRGLSEKERDSELHRELVQIKERHK